MKKFTKPVTLLPMLIGITAGALLFTIGVADDAPGLSLIGLVTAFLLIMWGIYNAGIITKEFLLLILLFSFGFGGILLSIVLLLDGELEKFPGMAIIGVGLGILLISLGGLRLHKKKMRD